MLNDRQERILLSLKKFDYLTVRQLQSLHDLKSYRNAYKVIRQLEGYYNVFKDNNTNVYYLNKKGREYVNSDKIRRRLTTTAHYIMRNNLFIYLGQPTSWRNEIRIKYESRKITVVADAHYVNSGKHYIIEIDNTQTMKKNHIKIEKYRRLIEHGVFKGMPKMIWVTSTAYRRDALLGLCEGLDVDVFQSTDIN